MFTYFIGDVHGCYNNLRSMLDHINFNPKMDLLYLTGDLIARGPNSLEVLRLIHMLGSNARIVLGNHEIHLLKVYFEKKNYTNQNYFYDILHASDADELIFWLRNQPILRVDEKNKILLTHAGIHPSWNINQVKKYAREIEELLSSNFPNLIFKENLKNKFYTNYIKTQKLKEIQKNINIFTRIRYIYSNGQLNFKYKNSPNHAPKYLLPWFNFPKITITSTYNIIFGHWSSLQDTKIPKKIYGLDSGCCWGGNLTSLQWETKKILRIPCNNLSIT